MKCCICRFWLRRHDGAKVGTCKRFPPTPAFSGGQLLPTTLHDDWCGEHQADAPEPPAAVATLHVEPCPGCGVPPLMVCADDCPEMAARKALAEASPPAPAKDLQPPRGKRRAGH